MVVFNCSKQTETSLPLRADSGSFGQSMVLERKMADDFPVLILTLDPNGTRVAPLRRWLDERCIQYELFIGVDGRNGLPPQWEAYVDRVAAQREMGRTMGDGEFACALSHMEMYRAVLERGLSGAIILEDDARPAESLVCFLRDESYRRAPLVLLDHTNTRVTRAVPIDLGTGIRGHHIALPPFLTTGYSIDAATARAIRARALPLSRTADWPCDISEFGAVAAMPRLVSQPEEEDKHSYLDHERVRQRRLHRFLAASYWQRWWRKRGAIKLPR